MLDFNNPKENYAMKTLIRLIIISMLMAVASPAYSEAIQIFNCEYEGEATQDDVFDMSAKWLAAAKTTKGGKNLKVYIRFPVAASVDDIDFKFVLVTPDFTEWGAFTDAYELSKLVEIDDELDKVAACNDSAMWEGEEIK
jgi:hypothetical protein